MFFCVCLRIVNYEYVSERLWSSRVYTCRGSNYIGSNLSGVFSTKEQRLGRSSPNGNSFSFFFKRYELQLPDCKLQKLNKENVVSEPDQTVDSTVMESWGKGAYIIGEHIFFIKYFECAGLYR